MADLSKCRALRERTANVFGDEAVVCDRRHHCYRFTATASSAFQSWIEPPPLSKEIGRAHV